MGQCKLLDIQTSIDLHRVSATEPAPNLNSDITYRGTISTGLILKEPLLVYADNSQSWPQPVVLWHHLLVLLSLLLSSLVFGPVFRVLLRASSYNLLFHKWSLSRTFGHCRHSLGERHLITVTLETLSFTPVSYLLDMGNHLSGWWPGFISNWLPDPELVASSFRPQLMIQGLN